MHAIYNIHNYTHKKPGSVLLRQPIQKCMHGMGEHLLHGMSHYRGAYIVIPTLHISHLFDTTDSSSRHFHPDHQEVTRMSHDSHVMHSPLPGPSRTQHTSCTCPSPVQSSRPPAHNTHTHSTQAVRTKCYQLQDLLVRITKLEMLSQHIICTQVLSIRNVISTRLVGTMHIQISGNALTTLCLIRPT